MSVHQSYSQGPAPSMHPGGQQQSAKRVSPQTNAGSTHNNNSTSSIASSIRAGGSMSTIESTVTRLLVATKQLLESLSLWAKGDASEQDVSDVYVSLGNEFNIACRAFISSGVEVVDLGDVPQALRVILEKALSEDASQENLDKYLPSIREIIINLLRQLKTKQQIIRSRQPQQPQPQQPQPQQPPQQRQPQQQPQPQKHPNAQPEKYPNAQPQYTPANAPRVQERSKLGAKYPTRAESLTSNRGSLEAEDQMGAPLPKELSHRASNPLLALQKSEALERRASRRFSAYQFAKLSNGGDTPPTPGSPGSPSFRRTPEKATSTLPTKAPHSSYKADYVSSTSVVEPDAEKLEQAKVLTPGREPVKEEKKRDSAESAAIQEASDERKSFGTDSTVNGAVSDAKEVKEVESVEVKDSGEPQELRDQEPKELEDQEPKELEDQEPKELGQNRQSIFLQVGRRVKKATVEGDISIPALRLLFMEKFTNVTAPGSDTLPEIYLQDANSGIRYELDESNLDDVHDGSLLSLNIEAMDEVKQQIDDSISKLIKGFSELSAKMEQNAAAVEAKISSISMASQDRLLRSGSEVAVSRMGSISHPDDVKGSVSLKDIGSLRRDVAVVRQISNNSISGLKEEIQTLLKKSQDLQSSSHIPPPSSSRHYMESCHKKLSSETDSLLTSVDDLQDVIEALRKDVAQRWVRHSPKQLESVSKDIEKAKEGLEKLEKFISFEKPSWKKIWERELDTICEEQQFFKLQEELVSDLQDDIVKAQETFKLVELCSQEQTKAGGERRPTVPIIPIPADGVAHAKDAVMSELTALKPNHDERVEAIERAERLRKRELQSRQGEFEEELEEFVGENKLKKSGGIEETERIRKEREERVRLEAMKSEAEAKAMRAKERELRKREKEEEAKEPASNEKDNDIL